MQIKAMEQMKMLFEKELVQTQLEIQEELLKDVAMEIHDNIGQVMMLSRINITILQSQSLPQGSADLVNETKLLLTKALDDITELSRNMHAERITEMGVLNAISQQLETLSQKGVFEVRIENQLSDVQIPLKKEVQLVIFRMFQEISKNIIKHAQATLVTFTVVEKTGGIELAFIDNGRGFDMTHPSQDPSVGGIGMKSLHTRAGLIGARISVTSAIQKGTSITIFIPIEMQ
ncbi:MAG: ATP-binding protein [Bacteroidota bacterium]